MSEQKIYNSLFADFVTSSLPTEEMRVVCKSLRDSGEYNSAMESSIINYKVCTELADEMLGIDTEVHQTKKNDEVDVRNVNRDDSNVVDKQKTTNKKENIMNNKFSQEDLTKINSLVESFNSANNPELSLEENMVNFYLNQFPGTFPEDALDVVNRIKSGVETFNTTLNEALSDDGIDYVEKIKKLAEGKTNEEKYELYINFLAAITTIDANNYESLGGEEIESFEEIKGKWLKPEGEVSDEMLNEVIAKVAEKMNNSTLFLSSADSVATIVENLPNGTDALTETVTGNEADVKNKLVTSLVTYIGIKNGTISFGIAEATTPETVATMVCATAEEMRVMGNLKKGIITVENAIKLLKIIGGVAMYCALAYLAVWASLNATIALMSFALFLGAAPGLSGTIAGILCLTFGVCSLVSLLTDIPEVVSWAGKAFDLFITKCSSELIPNIKKQVVNFIEWIREKIATNKVEATTDVTPSNVVVTTI